MLSGNPDRTYCMKKFQDLRRGDSFPDVQYHGTPSPSPVFYSGQNDAFDYFEGTYNENKEGEIKEGEIYRDSNVSVTAFNVKHGQWENAFGFVFQTKDKKIVVSGDCTYSENLIKYAKDCDILVHEVYADVGLKKRTQRWQDYHSTFHTSSYQLADIANKVKPKLLVLNHQLTFGTTLQSLLDEVKSKYKGAVVNGADLDIY